MKLPALYLLLLGLPILGVPAGSAETEFAPKYSIRFSTCALGSCPPGWKDLINYRPTRNWAIDGNGYLRVMLKEYVGNPEAGDRLVRRDYLEQFGFKYFAGLLAYEGSPEGRTGPTRARNVQLKATFKTTADTNVFFGVFLRLIDRDNYLTARFAGSNQLQILRVRNGKESLLKASISRSVYPARAIWTMEFKADGTDLRARLLDDGLKEQAVAHARVNEVRAGLSGLTATTFAAAESFAISVSESGASEPAIAKTSGTPPAQTTQASELAYSVVEPLMDSEALNTKFSAIADSYDIVVAGAGTGGWGAAVQASRMGAKVLLLEETDWIGGQMSAAAVTSMDEGGFWGKNTVRERGLYREFHESTINYYYTREKDPFAAYHFNRQSEGGYEPRVARGILYGLIQETRQRRLANGQNPILDLCVRTKVTDVEKDANRVIGVTLEEWTGGDPRRKRVACRMLIDATEYGDVLPLVGVRYRLGTTTSDKLVLSTQLQQHTWTGVIREYPGGIPEHLRIKSPPPGFDHIAKRFRNYTLDGARVWGKESKTNPGPRHWSVYVNWRGMADTASKAIGEATEQWHTRCGLNGGNDYSVTAGAVERMMDRMKMEREGINMTLGIIYWFQHTLGLPWAVAEDEGYFSDLNVERMRMRGIRDDLVPIAARLPQHPYARESRRMIGVRTMRSSDIATRARGKEQCQHHVDAVAINDYSMDLHGTRDQIELDLDSPDYINATGPFQVPFGVLIPESIDGFLPAEKNFSQSRLVNGATRLQPSTMLIGQAVGVMAALSVQKRIPTRSLNIIDAQSSLLAAGDTLMPRWYSDVRWGTPLWEATQLLSLYGIMDRPGPIDKSPLGEEWRWGVDDILHGAEATDAITKLGKLIPDSKALADRLPDATRNKVTRGVFALAASQALRTLGRNSVDMADLNAAQAPDSISRKPGKPTMPSSTNSKRNSTL